MASDGITIEVARRALRWSSIATAACVVLAPTWVSASVTIDNLELIDRTRVGRTTYNYTYRITATNTAPVELEDAVAYLSQRIPDADPTADTKFTVTPVVVDAAAGTYSPAAAIGTLLLDDEVVLGTLAAGETVVSDDVIVLQQDRQFQLDTDSLVWEVGFNATVTISGLVTDQPISFAGVEVTVDRIDSGRPIIESGRPIIERYSTTADEDGKYSVDVQFYTADDFVSITGDGVDNLDFVSLISIAGSAGSLLTQATVAAPAPGRAVATISIDGEDASELNVTHVSTALAVLATEANGGAGFTNDQDLAAAQAQVANDELLIAAAVLKTVIDTEAIDLPDGVDSTLDLLEDPDTFNEFVTELEEQFPEELEQAIEDTIGDLSVDYVAAELPETLYLTIVRENPLLIGAHLFTFDQGGSGTHIDSIGETTDATWVVDAEGNIVVSLNNPPQNEFFTEREVPPASGNFQQVRALQNLTELRVVRLAVGVATDQVLLGTTYLTTFPDDPSLPDETDVNEPAPENARLAYDASGFLPYTTEELAGQVREFEYFRLDNNSVGLLNDALGADLLTFNADGSGITERRDFAFNWSVDAEGRLSIVFDNGDSNVYARYTKIDQGVVDLGVLVGRYGANAAASDNISVRPGGVSAFTEADLLERKFRFGAGIADEGLLSSLFSERFDFNFLPGGEGCLDSGFPNPFDWIISGAGYMELQRFRNEPPELFRQRSWRPVAIVPGSQGPRYWVIENLDLDDTAPGFPTDPTLTPGRVNFYEYIKDISGNTAPIAVADDASTEPGTPVFIDVLANDTDTQDDVVIIVGWSGSSLGGTVEPRLDAETASFYDGFIYTPPAGVNGMTDTFTYSVADSSCAYGPVDAGTVSVTISGLGPSVFVTSSKHDGNLGGVAGGDAICQARASEVGLSGTYFAWLGAGAITPDSRFDRRTTPYTRVDGAVVASDYDDLVDGNIAIQIDVTETNQVVNEGDVENVWTGLGADGATVFTNCSGWTCNLPGCVGETGKTNRNNDDWSSVTGLDCSVERRLYCFLQSPARSISSKHRTPASETRRGDARLTAPARP